MSTQKFLHMLLSQQEAENTLKRDRFYGIYRGIVEWNLDPLEIGRVKARIPQIHGMLPNVIGESGIAPKSLPWASPCFMGAGTFDSGQYDVPPIGSVIWVIFEAGDPESPVYIGGWPSIPEKAQEMNTIVSKSIPGKQVSMGTWSSPANLDTPKETQNRPNAEPTRRVVFKTPKGATIYAEDKDGAEFLRVVDRIGQVIEMFSPVTVEKNKGNTDQRGTKMTVDETPTVDPHTGPASMKTQIPVGTDAVNQEAWITLKDARGQYLKLWAKQDEEKVILYGKSGHFIILDSTSGSEKIRIEDKAGNYTEINSVSGNKEEEIGADWNVTVGGNAMITVSGTCTITAAIIDLNP